jgi:hypothetical protein
MLWEPDIIANVTLFPTAEGGREGPTPANWFGCPFVLPNGDLQDARMDLTEHGPLAPGETARLPIKFLNPEAALPKMKIGSVLQLRELGVIGKATVLEMRSSS